MNRRSSSLRILLVAFAMLSFIAINAGIAHGQAISGNLTGTVTDASAAALNGATVEAVNLDTNQKVTSTTRGSGEYLFTNLPVGNYKITVSATGFKTTTLASVPVDLNRTGTANVQLQVGTSATTVEVSGVAPPVDTTSAQLQSTYNETYSKDLGITSNGQGAGVLNLSLLSPGVTNASAMGLGVGPSVGGQRPRDNNFTVEGVDNNNKSVTGALISVPNDAVEDFTLLSNQFNSEFGHSSGGQFNTTVKSGTNNFHGSLYEYFRNRNLDAIDQTYVNQGLKENPRFDSNRFGGTIGGPIIKNKLFFFFDFEYQPTGLTGATPGAVFTPTAAGLQAIKSDPTLSATNYQVFTQYTPVGSSAGAQCITYNGFTNKTQKINTNQGAIPFVAPANGSCGAGFVETGPVSIVPPAYINYKNLVASVDYNISGKDQLRGRYIFNNVNQIDTAAQLPAFYATEPTKYRLINISEYHTFTPTVTNEFRVGFNRFDSTVPVNNLTFPGLGVFPNLTFYDQGAGLVLGPDGNAPQFTIQNFYQFVDNVSWVKGKHSFKFGGEYRWYISPQQFTQRARGDYQYNASQTYFEDFSPDNFGERSAGLVTYYGNQKAFYWYANDTWHMTPHLTMNLGIRYEYTTTPTGEDRQSLNAESSQPNLIIPQVNQPLIFGAPQAPKNNWAPRVGIAYSPGNSGDTSIRAGFGMAYDVLYDNIGILAVPPQIGSTHDVDPGNLTPGFLAGGGLPGGGSGLKTFPNAAAAIAATTDWMPYKVHDPYSINWSLGVQHSFGKSYSAEVNYVGTRGDHLDVQSHLNTISPVTPQNALPTYLQAPSQAVLNALPNTLTSLENIDPFYGPLEKAGFNQNFLTGFIPAGWSTYHALQTQLSRRFSNGLQFTAAYTWSHTIDNSTADFHSTDLTPRRGEDFFNINKDKATSALSRTHRLTIAAVYNLPYFKTGNWFVRNVAGNWQFSPIYTYESPEYVTVQSNLDSNLNFDAAGDRAVLNPGGASGVGSDVTPLTNSAGDTVAYLAVNPNARYIVAGPGAYANVGRNTLATRPTDDIDLALYKDLNFTERFKFRLGAQFGNLFNHPQFIPGSNPGLGLGVNDVNSFNTVGGTYKSFAVPSDPNFNNPKAVFASNARTLGLVMKFIF